MQNASSGPRTPVQPFISEESLVPLTKLSSYASYLHCNVLIQKIVFVALPELMNERSTVINRKVCARN